jgi:hypothetical protein
MEWVGRARDYPRLVAAFVAFVGWAPIILVAYPLLIKKPATTAIVFSVPAVFSIVFAALLFGPWVRKPISHRVLRCCAAGVVCSAGTMFASGVIPSLIMAGIRGDHLSIWSLTIYPLSAGMGMLIMGTYLGLGMPHILGAFGGAVVAKLVRPASDMPSN